MIHGMKSMYNMKPFQVVVGLGKTGVSCIRYLVENGYSVAVTDSREHPPGLDEIKAAYPQVTFALGGFDKQLCKNASRIILSPGVWLREPAITEAIAAGVPVVGDIELFALSTKTPIVGITGSNGKSTVTTLLGEMGKAAGIDVCVGGNLGEPVLDLLHHSQPYAYALELSSFQLETTFSLHAETAVVLNLSEDHMDRYDNLSEYLQAKQRIYTHCRHPVINRNDPITWQNLGLSHPLSFGLDAPPNAKDFGLITHQGVTCMAQGKTALMPITDLKMKGRHQVANSLAALALGYNIQLPMESMLHALRTFPGLPHRCQWVANINGVDWYNDSKATNVGAAQAAIEGLGPDIAGKLIIIGGGQGKGADFSPLSEGMKKFAKLLILMGQDAPLMETALHKDVSIQRVENLDQAVDVAKNHASAGDAVLLAPACASLDMFKNFEHRGEMFMDLVRTMI